MRYAGLLLAATVAVLSIAQAQPLYAQLLWGRTSVAGAAYSVCTGTGRVYVVGYEGSAYNATGRIEERLPTDGSLARSTGDPGRVLHA